MSLRMPLIRQLLRARRYVLPAASCAYCLKPLYHALPRSQRSPPHPHTPYTCPRSYMYKSSLPNTKFIFPHAPRRPITINFGMSMPGW